MTTILKMIFQNYKVKRGMKMRRNSLNSLDKENNSSEEIEEKSPIFEKTIKQNDQDIKWKEEDQEKILLYNYIKIKSKPFHEQNKEELLRIEDKLLTKFKTTYKKVSDIDKNALKYLEDKFLKAKRNLLNQHEEQTNEFSKEIKYIQELIIIFKSARLSRKEDKLQQSNALDERIKKTDEYESKMKSLIKDFIDTKLELPDGKNKEKLKSIENQLRTHNEKYKVLILKDLNTRLNMEIAERNQKNIKKNEEVKKTKKNIKNLQRLMKELENSIAKDKKILQKEKKKHFKQKMRTNAYDNFFAKPELTEQYLPGIPNIQRNSSVQKSKISSEIPTSVEFSESEKNHIQKDVQKHPSEILKSPVKEEEKMHHEKQITNKKFINLNYKLEKGQKGNLKTLIKDKALINDANNNELSLFHSEKDKAEDKMTFEKELPTKKKRHYLTQDLFKSKLDENIRLEKSKNALPDKENNLPQNHLKKKSVKKNRRPHLTLDLRQGGSLTHLIDTEENKEKNESESPRKKNK